MREISYPLRKALFDLLKVPLDGYALYYMYVPETVRTDIYFVINPITQNDSSTMHSFNTVASLSITGYSQDTFSNAGKSLEQGFDIIYQTLFPARNPVLNIGDDQNVIFKRVSDNTLSPFSTSDKVLIGRTLIIEATVAHRQ